MEDAEWEKVLKDMAVATTKDKGKGAEATEKKAQATKKAWLVAEKKVTEMEVKLGGTKLKLAEAESLNLAQVDVIVDLKTALKACKEKWYSEGFADAKNSVEPIVYQAWQHGFGEG